MIGERVHRTMFRKRVPATQLARKMGISQSTMSKKLHGDRPWTPDDIYKAAYFLGVDPQDFMPALEEWLPHLDSNQKPFGYWLGGPPPGFRLTA